MRIRSVIVSALLAVALVITALPAGAQEPLLFVVHGSAGAVQAYRNLFDRFTAETGIEVDIMHVSTAIHGKWEQIIVMTLGGVSPDIVAGVSTEFGEFAMNGMLESLNPYLERDGLDIGELLPSFTNALQIEGEQYILPYGSSAFPLAYNRAHFDIAGLARPPAQWGSPNWTWDDFVNAARKLTISDGEEVQQWGVAAYPVADYWQTIPYAFGGTWLSSDLRQFLGTSQPVVDALSEYASLAHHYGALNPRGHQDDFLAEMGSMAAAGTWMLPRLARADIDWDFMPWFTYQDNQPAGVIFPIGFGLLSASSKKDQAWELIKWIIFDEDNNFAYADAAGAVPSLMVNLYPWMQQQLAVFGRDISIGVVAEQMEKYHAVVEARMTPAFSRINPIIRSAVQSIFNNEVDARAGMESIENQINMLLQEAMQ